MKLDYDIVRALMIYVEENIRFGGFKDTGKIAKELDLREIDVTYTAVKLQEAGFVILNSKEWTTPVQASCPCLIYSLTFSGHEYLNSIRNDSVWAKVREAIKKHGDTFTFQIITSFAKAIIEQQLFSVLSP